MHFEYADAVAGMPCEVIIYVPCLHPLFAHQGFKTSCFLELEMNLSELVLVQLYTTWT